MPEPDGKKASFTGRRGRHKTRWTVRFADRASGLLITVGGIGTILAVSLVGVLLVWVAFPLFGKARIINQRAVEAPMAQTDPLQLAVDEYKSLGWALYRDGTLRVFRPGNGDVLGESRLLPDDVVITAIAFNPSESTVALGFADGTVRLGSIEFKTTFLERNDVPDSIREMQVGEVAALDVGVVQLTAQRQFRTQRVEAQVGDPMPVGDTAIVQLDQMTGPQGPVVGVVSADGTLLLGQISENFLTGATTFQGRKLPAIEQKDSVPDHILVPGRGESVLAIWNDGRLVRFDARNPSQIEVAEEVDLLEDRPGASLAAVRLDVSRGTLLVGDTKGGLRAWFPVRSRDARTSDGAWLLPIHELEACPAALTALGVSKRSRMLTAGYADGRVRLYHVTTGQLLLQQQLPGNDPVTRVLMSPKDDGLFAATSSSLWQADLDPRYPEVDWKSLFRPVWYEGQERPDLIWQSSFAGVGPEMKLSLRPLIFGTLKATVYSMFFGAPLAVLAAIYTSEFLHPRVRSHVKSVIEMMASLPSVVLGFLAALVIAPVIERVVPTTLCVFFTVPFVFLLAAFLWQLLPHYSSLVLARFRLLFVSAALAAGFWLAWRLGPVAERLFFAGDMMMWLDGQKGTGTGAWLLMMLPLSSLLTAIAVTLWVNSYIRGISTSWSRRKFALVNLAKFLVAAGVAFGIAVIVSEALTAAQLDPRGTYVGTYVPRNALIVGFVMGFAIIPIIYTISEDALSTVPSHLRSASLGAGATPWQTAVRIVIPTAMSGLFSALMIGLGRAVGETMIVLMAAGNTPVRQWNLFNGFRTLSANIAVELPEAVKDSTHYRTLFLAALTLFVLTFCVNTVAELVRVRFRRRAVQL